MLQSTISRLTNVNFSSSWLPTSQILNPKTPFLDGERPTNDPVVLDAVLGERFMPALVGNLKMYDQAQSSGNRDATAETKRIHGKYHDFGLGAIPNSDSKEKAGGGGATHEFFLMHTMLRVEYEDEDELE